MELTRRQPRLTPDFESAHKLMVKLKSNINKVIRCNNPSIDWMITAFVAGGHVLLEDVPGTGKTTLAKTLAASIDAEFKRIQFTPDLLPTDILGVSIFNQSTQDFQFRKGPIFTQILLADEINRASPRTQSALLEAMAEGQVSVEGDSVPMHDLFFVMATQNPVEFHGTYPLPEAQMDRFSMRFELGYVSREDEVNILDTHGYQNPLDDLQACSTGNEIMNARKVAAQVRISSELKHYIVDLVAETRKWPGIQMGASPRAGLTLMKCSQALALLAGDEFVTPEHIHQLAEPVIAHRLSLDPNAQFSGTHGKQLVKDILNSVAVPT